MKNELAGNLKKLLSKKNISARKLAKDTGMSISTVSDVLNGRQPSLKNLQIISEYFDVSLDALVKGEEKPASQIELSSEDFEDMFEGIVKIKISKLKPRKR